MTKTRQPSAGDERISLDEVRRIAQACAETMGTLADEAPRALAVAREWSGHTRSTLGGSGGRGGDTPDPTGTLATSRPDDAALVYERLVRHVRDLSYASMWISRLLMALRASNEDSGDVDRLERLNAVRGPCDGCATNVPGTRHDRLRPVADLRVCPACWQSWLDGRRRDPDLTVPRWLKMRAKRLEREPA